MKCSIIIIFLLIMGGYFCFEGDLKTGLQIVFSGIIIYIVVQIIDSIVDESEENRTKIINSFKVHNEKDTVIYSNKKSNNIIDKQYFLNFAKNMFVKYHTGIKEKNLKILKTLVTPEFFYEQEKIIKEKGIIKNNSDFLEIEKIYFPSNIKLNETEDITVGIKYIEIKNEYNVATGEKIVGLTKKITKKVYITFKKVKDETKKGINNTNCPICGAPTEIFTTGKCQYCGELIQIENLVWKINGIRYIN